AALAVSAALDVSGVVLDYSIGSLNRVDEILDDFRRRRVAVERIAETLFCFGCYVGEVFVRNAHGRWVDVERTPMRGRGQWMIVIELPDGSVCNPIGKVFNRVENGSVDALSYFYETFAGKSAR